MSAQPEPVRVKIDFVSDVSCPWCAIGLKSLEQALAQPARRGRGRDPFPAVRTEPATGAGGRGFHPHLMQKYGSSAEQIDANREVIRARGEALGFTSA